MGRRKIIKEYTIKLIHPELGEWYYHYNNNYYNKSCFYFTQDLSKVTTWKTIKYVQREIKKIIEKLEKSKKYKIFLEFGKDPKEELKDKMNISRKKYYYPIESVTSKVHFDNAKTTIDTLNKSLVDDSKMITKMIRKNKHIEDNFNDLINKLVSDVKEYKENFNFLEKNNKNNSKILLDIVDASYGFRLLKLRTLKKKSEDEEISN